MPEIPREHYEDGTIWEGTGKVRLRPTWRGVVIEELSSHYSGQRKWVRVKRPIHLPVMEAV